MGNFDYLIEHLKRKKEKKGNNGYFGKPIIEESELMLIVEYNHYHVAIEYDPECKKARPLYCPYRLWIEKPCVITRGGSQDLGTAFYEEWWSSQEDVWEVLQQKWKRTIK